MPGLREKKTHKEKDYSASDLKNAVGHFGRALNSVLNLMKIIVIGDDVQVAGKLMKQSFSKLYEEKSSNLSGNSKEIAIKKEKEYSNEVKKYLSSSAKSGLSELKNIAMELTLGCWDLLKSLTKATVAVASIGTNIALKSVVPSFKSKLLDCKTISVEEPSNEAPRPK